MAKGTWFSIVITRKTLTIILTVFVVIAVFMSATTIYEYVERRMYGVKPGVKILGQDVSGLLVDELPEALVSITEAQWVEARNASYDWERGLVRPEQIGRLVDIGATVEVLMSARPFTEVDFVTVEVLPSVTQANFTPYYKGTSGKPQVSLMVNVDWGNEYIPSMLATFARYNIATTWFPTGNWAEKFPELAMEIAAAGHELGNHGGWHGMASQMSADQVRDLILSGEEKIVNATGQKPMVFAPPAGDMNKQTVAVAAELGYKTILWTIDTVDWQRPAPTVIVDRVIGRIENDALILMHPTEPTAQALPLIIEQLIDKGYEVVTVSELLWD